MNTPWYKDGDFWIGAVFWAGLLSLIFWQPLTSFAGSVHTYVTKGPLECQTVSILHQERTEERPFMEPSESYTDYGSDGTRHICSYQSGEITLDHVLTKPVDTVHYKGTYVKPAPQPVYYESGGGAICNDGWRSYSTGRGTCSWHGGVAYYL